MQDLELGHAGLLAARETPGRSRRYPGDSSPASPRWGYDYARRGGLVNVSVADGSVSNLVGAGSGRSPLD